MALTVEFEGSKILGSKGAIGPPAARDHVLFPQGFTRVLVLIGQRGKGQTGSRDRVGGLAVLRELSWVAPRGAAPFQTLPEERWPVPVS